MTRLSQERGSMAFSWPDICGIMIDIDGTLWRGPLAMPGLTEFFQFLQEYRLAYKVGTNNSTRTLAQYQKRFLSFGVQIAVEDIFTASLVAGQYLKQQFPHGGTAFILGHDGLEEAIHSAGLSLVSDMSQKADVVVAGGDRALTYEKLKNAVLHIQRGALFVGTNPDIVYPTDEGMVPECGTILAALQAATGVHPVVMGKPEPYLYQQAAQALGCLPEQTIILGDRLDTDIVGGHKAGFKTVLVTTGVDNLETIAGKVIQPDLVVANLIELTALWKAGLNAGPQQDVQSELHTFNAKQDR